MAIYVIQSHEAHRAGHHWDLRLEVPEGDLTEYLGKRTPSTPEPMTTKSKHVLRSWAIPKHTLPVLGGPPLMIVPTEDHMMEWGTFEGTIPSGYGAGTVKIVEKGRYLMESVHEDGSHKFILYRPSGYQRFKIFNIRGSKPTKLITQLEYDGMITADSAIAIWHQFIETNRDKILKTAIVGGILRGHDPSKDLDILVALRPGYQIGDLDKIDNHVELYEVSLEAWSVGVLHWAPGKAILSIKAALKSQGYTLRNQHGLYQGNKLISTDANEICKLAGIEVPEPVKESLGGKFLAISKDLPG